MKFPFFQFLALDLIPEHDPLTKVVSNYLKMNLRHFLLMYINAYLRHATFQCWWIKVVSCMLLLLLYKAFVDNC